MRTRRLVFAAILAVMLAVTTARLSAFACFPGCALYTPWDIPYYIFNCWRCDGPSPEG